MPADGKKERVTKLNRKDFITEWTAEKTETDKTQAIHQLKKFIDNDISENSPRGTKNLIIAIEELSELTKEISKWLRKKGDWYGILEEMTDAQLALWYIQEICNITDSDLKKALSVKLKRESIRQRISCKIMQNPAENTCKNTPKKSEKET